MPRKPRKGDRLTYTGTYASGITTRYPPGEVVAFRTNRGVPCVTVKLDVDSDHDPAKFTVEALYADWPIAETAPVP